MEIPEIIREIAKVLDEGKAESIVILDMREVSGFTDFMLVASGRSNPHVRALVDAVEKNRRAQGAKPTLIEGRAEGAWVLLDYFDLLVHVFTEEARGFYQLERLWRDAPLLEWSAEPAAPEPPVAEPEPVEAAPDEIAPEA
ncbi:MAG: ribosome silencing factor [Acidobacteria bacterium]|nr:ribosome silencing factor [Acidobacteriota bacterium]